MASQDASASARLEVLLAPGGLSLVQDLLNTAAIAAFRVADLLADASSAAVWLEGALDVWAGRTGQRLPVLSLSGGDLVALRDGRDRTRAWLAGDEVDLPASTVVLRSRDGEVVYEPGADGVDGLLGLVAAELLLGQRDGSLARLKTCANPGCRTAFFDQSRNSSRVWHDVKTCGNVTNLRASRARRRAVDGGRSGS